MLKIPIYHSRNISKCKNALFVLFLAEYFYYAQRVYAPFPTVKI